MPHLVIQVKKKATQKVGPSVSDVKTDSRNHQNCNEALVWSSSRPLVQFPLNSLEFLTTPVVSLVYMLPFNGNKTEKPRIPDVCQQCSSTGYDRTLHSVHRHREKSMHKKALNSCSVSSFTAGIIKGGFYRLSNPNFPISRWRPVQSRLCSIQGKRLHLGILWRRLYRNSVDCTEGRAIDMHCVAVHSVGICT